MRVNTYLVKLAFGLSTMAFVASAWPAGSESEPLVVRQEEEEPDAPVAPNTSQADLNTAVLNTATDASAEATITGTNTNAPTRTGREEFDPTNPAGGIVAITPAPNAPTPALYKIGDFITWEWNYTNLLANPTAVDLILSCTLGPRSWTLTGNMSFETIGTYTWDSSVQESDVSSPLLTEQYSLIIKDSEDDIKDPPAPGYLSPTSGFSFSMYKRKEYKPLDEWHCATCSAGSRANENRALAFAATMSLISILSFTWFLNGLHL